MRMWFARVMVVVVALLWGLAVVGTTGCGKKEEDPAAQGYYEGPMLPKSRRTGSAPGQGTTE